jgi:hypothetical protein
VPHGPTKGIQPPYEMTHAAFHSRDLIQIPHGLSQPPTYDQKLLKHIFSTFVSIIHKSPIPHFNAPQGLTKYFQPPHDMIYAAFHPHDLIQIPHAPPQPPTYHQK